MSHCGIVKLYGDKYCTDSSKSIRSDKVLIEGKKAKAQFSPTGITPIKVFLRKVLWHEKGLDSLMSVQLLLDIYYLDLMYNHLKSAKLET